METRRDGRRLDKRCVGWALLVMLGQGLAACGDGNPTAPTSAGPPAPFPTPARPGNYEVVFVADAACTELPPVARTRTYTGAHDGFLVRLSGSDFSVPTPIEYAWDVIVLALSQDSASAYFSDPPIWERPTPDTDLMIEGNARGTVGRDGQQISFSFRGTFLFCPAVDRGEKSYSKCEVPRIRCASNNHRLTISPG